ncbi:MAG: C40 family peptidase, partial [Simkaniaceae bacterium]|nr:C40 family peptidase [Simkaniaceae bacterium]
KVLEVKTEEYSSNQSLYIDARFITPCAQKELKKKVLPSKEEILAFLVDQVGVPYVWGGNFTQGIPELKEMFPPKDFLTPLEKKYWMFKGCDCSGLLYEATNGVLPRNTRELRTVGRAISMEDLQPLDLVVYTEKDGSGHVFIVLNKTEVIESKLGFGGVKITSLKERLNMLASQSHVQIKKGPQNFPGVFFRRFFEDV